MKCFSEDLIFLLAFCNLFIYFRPLRKSIMKNILMTFLLLLFVVSCRNSDDAILEKNVTATDLYVAGKENNEACYWKNNVKTVLSNGTNFFARKVFVHNNDIYVLAEENIITNGINYYYWKNNVKHSVAQDLGLPLNTSNHGYFFMCNFFVQDGDLYIAGLMENPSPSSPQNQYQFCYWKNGIKTIVFEQQEFQTSASIYIIDNDIYVPIQSNIINTPSMNWDFGYYKNGVYQYIAPLSGCIDIHNNGTSTKMLIKDQANQTLYYRDLSNGTITSPPSFLTYNNIPTIHQMDGNNEYFVTNNTEYYRNNVSVSLNPFGSNFQYLDDFKVLDDNVYKIMHTDDNTGVNFKVYLNNVEVQSTSNSNTNYTEFNSLTIVQQ